jgi:hypothetical protein
MARPGAFGDEKTLGGGENGFQIQDSKIATSNAAEMASRGTLPEGARSLREKKADGRAEWGRWARVYTRKYL